MHFSREMYQSALFAVICAEMQLAASRAIQTAALGLNPSRDAAS